MTKKKEDEIKREVEQLLRHLEALEHDARTQGLLFFSLNREELTRKIKGESARSPFFLALSWKPLVPQGDRAKVEVVIYNPDSTTHSTVVLSSFFGVAPPLDDSQFLAAAARGNFNADSKWPYTSTQPFSLAPGMVTGKSLEFTTPTNVPLTNYIGNLVLWGGFPLMIPGKPPPALFDRGHFWITPHVTLSQLT